MNLPFRKFGSSKTLILMRNLGIMLRSGIPLDRALSLLEKDTSVGKHSVLAHLRQSIETGHPLAQAMETSPRKFPGIAINLVRVGEMAGTLEESLFHIVQHLQKARELKRKIKGAMMYPTFVLVAVVGLGLSISTLVLPKLIPLFQSLQIDLPLSTRILMWLAVFFNEYGIAVLVGILSLFILFITSIQIRDIRYQWHRFLMVIPLIKTLRRQAAMAQIGGTLSTLLKSGVHIREAVETTAGATENLVFQRALLQTLPFIESGHSFSDGVRSTGNIIPELAIVLMEIGEETGTLTETLEYLSEYFELEVDFTMKTFTTALEPILLIGIGALVGFVVIAILTPIYDVTGGVL